MPAGTGGVDGYSGGLSRGGEPGSGGGREAGEGGGFHAGDCVFRDVRRRNGAGPGSGGVAMTGGLPEPARLQAREAVEVARRGLSVAGVDRNRARSETRTVVVVSPDARLRQRLASSLAGLRWWVREARGGAQAMMLLGEQGAEAMVVDHWLPDLEVGEFGEQARLLYPEMDLLLLDRKSTRLNSSHLGISYAVFC